MTLVQLANFVRIAEIGSLSKAAAVLRIAQPALSRQMRNLEEELGSSLLVRHAWGVSLTAAGDALLSRARRTLLEAEAARNAVAALAEQPSGRVVIGVPTSLAAALIPTLAAALDEKYPRLVAHFIDGFSAVLHARTLSGEIDLSALYEDRPSGPLHTSPLLAETLMLVGPAGASVEPAPVAEMLADLRLILPARPNRLRLIIDEALLPNARRRLDLLEVDSLPATIGMVEQGAGFTVLPYSAVAVEVARGAVKAWPVEGLALSRTLLLARSVDRPPTPSISVVEGEIRSLVRRLAEPLRWRAL